MKTLLFVALVAAYAAGAWACCMVPRTYQGSIGQDAQEAVLIHDGDREELVLRINYRITGETMPEQFAWVVTVPQEPDAYEVADADLFEEMFDLAERLLVPKPRSVGVGCAKVAVDSAMPKGVELGKAVTVGPYDIQPVRGVGPHALKGLNTWLGSHGFPTEEPAHMRYFVENNFTFLCIRITPKGEERSVTANGLLPPLHLSFESARPYYPLRFSSRQGVFDVNLHMLTRKPLDYDDSKATLTKMRWSTPGFKRNVKLSAKGMPDTLKQVFDKTVWKDKVGRWRYNNLRCYRVNAGDTIRTWEEDVTFATQ